MNRNEWIRTNSIRICEEIINDYERIGNLYCKVYVTDDERYQILADYCDEYLTLGLSDNRTTEVIDKTQSKMDYADIYEALDFLFDWLKEEEIC